MHYYEIQSFLAIGKKSGFLHTTVVAYLATIVQPFPIFRKLLAIIPSVKNHPHLKILNQKSIPILNHLVTNSTRTVLPNQL